MLIRITVANRGPEPATLARAADAVVPQHLVAGAARGEGYWPKPRIARRGDDASSRAEHATLGACCSTPTPAPTARADAAVHRERDQRRAALRRAERDAVREGRVPRRTSSTAQRDAVNPAGDGHQGGARTTRSTIPAGGERDVAPAARRRPARRRATPFGAGVRRDLRRRASREADAFYARAHPGRRSTDDERAVVAPGVRRPALVEAVLPLRRAATGSRAIRRSRRRRPSARDGPQPRLARTSTTATSSRCPTSGSTRGTRRGTSRST